MSTVKIRSVSKQDVGDILALVEQLGYCPKEMDIAARIELYNNNLQYKIFAVEMEGNGIIGFVSLHIMEFFHYPMTFARLTALAVDEKHQRTGIGKILIEAAEKYAKEQNCEFVELTSGIWREDLGSHDFYKALGYQDNESSIKKYFRKQL